MTSVLSEDESRILGALLAGDHAGLATLRQQLLRSKVNGRDFTGAGFLVHFTVDTDAPRLAPGFGAAISDAGGMVSGADVGFILFVRDGALDCLECHSWGEGEIPDDWRLEEIHYLRHGADGMSLVPTGERDASRLEGLLEAC